jgi:hypothetical protein
MVWMGRAEDMPDEMKSVTTPDWDAIYLWFNHWLLAPLSDREKVLVREAYHAFQYPEALERYKSDPYKN